ncbi:MAG: sigma 54-interacting transcriptional regulator [Acidobacteriia bacterium]|nr:sigma 54-interacting transcriptional regulator [Terriglobia bacterium]
MKTADQKYRAFLELTAAIASKQDSDSVFHAAVQVLRSLMEFNYVAAVTPDRDKDTFQIRVMELDRPNAVLAQYMEVPHEGSLAGWVYDHRRLKWIADVETSSEFPSSLPVLNRAGLKCICAAPMIVRDEVIGILSIACTRRVAYEPDDLAFFEEVAHFVAVAYDNALSYEKMKRLSLQLKQDNENLQEKIRLEQQHQVVLRLSTAIMSHLNKADLFRSLFRALYDYVSFDVASVGLVDEARHTTRLYLVVSSDSPRSIDLGKVHHPPAGEDDFSVFEPQLEFPIERDSLAQHLIQRKDILCVGDIRSAKPWKPVTEIFLKEGLLSFITIPVVIHGKVLGGFTLSSRQTHHFDDVDRAFLKQVANQVAIALRNAAAFEEIEELKDQLKNENIYLQEEIRTEQNFDEVVGDSRALRRVLTSVERVARTDSTVLITGETGTGKELIARAIHTRSPRKDRAFVKVSCAAIPLGLIESELFGHEKGAFTGAIARTSGRFELADGGSVFLDEIGEIPKEVQVKLLRVLQEREFERVGGDRSLKVDVRVIAATNRDLEAMVRSGDFRQDLFFRLNIFPLHLPPLRERREDIPPLVHYFLHKHSLRMNKELRKISTRTMEAFRNYDWPGNIRELENVIERGVILCEGDTLELKYVAAALEPDELVAVRGRTLEEFEREHILQTLKETHGVIGGAHGAAARLGMNRTTLNSRLQKLGIRRVSRSSEFKYPMQ